MILQLRRLFERIGDKMDLNAVISLEELGDYGASVCFTSPVKLTGKLQNIAGMVTLDYTLETTVLLVCDRCLDEFERAYRLENSHVLVRNEEGLEGEDDLYCPDCALDMCETAISDLLISLPTKILCREDCKGLCPECGKNLNHGDCECKKV